MTQDGVDHDLGLERSITRRDFFEWCCPSDGSNNIALRGNCRPKYRERTLETGTIPGAWNHVGRRTLLLAKLLPALIPVPLKLHTNYAMESIGTK
jgi:hypothetical protein